MRAAIFSIMLLCAVGAVLWPLYRSERRLSGRAIGFAVAVALVSALTYYQIGQPQARFEAATVAAAPDTVEEMVVSLAARLQENPDDIEGWKMLGRSYTVMNRFDDAVDAWEQAARLENASDGLTLSALGEVLFLQNNESLNGRAGELFESSLALVPGNAKGLFYSGLAAADRGDNDLAAQRWQSLLATSPPEEVANVLRQRIAEWRGEPPPVPTSPAPASGGTALQIDITLADVIPELDPGSTVFIIARDPAQPAPPIAVDRRLFEELPARVILDSRHEMLPGRSLSGFETLEIIVRVSPGGQPRAASGDWFGSALINVAEGLSTSIQLNQQVP